MEYYTAPPAKSVLEAFDDYLLSLFIVPEEYLTFDPEYYLDLLEEFLTRRYDHLDDLDKLHSEILDLLPI
jgi:hypothetical protein